MAVSAREGFLYMAKVAGKAERYEEMVEFMEKFCYATNGSDLTEEEMNLLSIAYKNVTRSRRTSWRIMFSMEKKAWSRCKVNQVQVIREYRAEIESELSRFCKEIIKLVESTLLPSAASEDSKVFYFKMVGDYFRYLAEVKTGHEKQAATDSTLAAYKSAQDYLHGTVYPFFALVKSFGVLLHFVRRTISRSSLQTHPIRLGLACNFSVFYYEILESPDRACNLAKSALDAAVTELNTLGQESSKGSSVFMQILRDNINLWTSDMKDDSADEMKETSVSKLTTGK